MGTEGTEKGGDKAGAEKAQAAIHRHNRTMVTNHNSRLNPKRRSQGEGTWMRQCSTVTPPGSEAPVCCSGPVGWFSPIALADLNKSQLRAAKRSSTVKSTVPISPLADSARGRAVRFLGVQHWTARDADAYEL